MLLYLKILQTYISAGQLTITSHSYDNYDYVYSIAGVQYGRDNIKNFHVNMCTYLNKGVTDYIGVWDYDEHFTPLGTHKNIIDVINSIETKQSIQFNDYFQTDIQTDTSTHTGQTNTPTDGQTDTQTDGRTNTQTDGQTDTQTDTQTDGYEMIDANIQLEGLMDIPTDTQTDIQTNIQTDTQTNTQTNTNINNEKIITKYNINQLLYKYSKTQTNSNLIYPQSMSQQLTLNRTAFFAAHSAHSRAAGLADGDTHPACYYILNSRVTLYEKAYQKNYDLEKPWIGMYVMYVM